MLDGLEGDMDDKFNAVTKERCDGTGVLEPDLLRLSSTSHT